MTNFKELREHIQANTKTVTMREIRNKTHDIWRTMIDNNETTLDSEFYEEQMLSWYIICCETRHIVPTSGY